MSKTVLILGAGVGGLTTADTLRQLLPPEDRIILVDRSFDGTLGLSLLWVLRGWRRPDDVRVRPTAASLPGVEMVTATVAHIDIAAQVVHTDNSVIGYDALVIALGAALNTDAVPGLSDALDADVAGQFYTLDGAAELRAKVEALEHGRIAVAIAGVPFKCPAAPFEAAFLIAAQLGDRYATGTVQIDTFTPDPLPMPVAGPEVGEALVSMLKDHGVGFHPRKALARVDEAARTMHFGDGTSEPFDLLAVVPPHVPSAAARSAGLSESGWIPVDPRTLSAIDSTISSIHAASRAVSHRRTPTTRSPGCTAGRGCWSTLWNKRVWKRRCGPSSDRARRAGGFGGGYTRSQCTAPTWRSPSGANSHWNRTWQPTGSANSWSA